MKENRILIIEDNPLNLQLFTDLLEVKGYVILKAERAEEGIEIARKVFPDLILMDISMPGMDGLEATAILKKDPTTNKIPVIALTAHAMKGDEEKAFSSGCSGYISKPIDTRNFVKEIARFLNSGK